MTTNHISKRYSKMFHPEADASGPLREMSLQGRRQAPGLSEKYVCLLTVVFRFICFLELTTKLFSSLVTYHGDLSRM